MQIFLVWYHKPRNMVLLKFLVFSRNSWADNLVKITPENVLKLNKPEKVGFVIYLIISKRKCYL